MAGASGWLHVQCLHCLLAAANAVRGASAQVRALDQTFTMAPVESTLQASVEWASSARMIVIECGRSRMGTGGIGNMGEQEACIPQH